MALVIPMASMAFLIGSTALELVKSQENVSDNVPETPLDGMTQEQLKAALQQVQLDRKAAFIKYHKKLDELERKKRLRKVVTIAFACLISIIALSITLFIFSEGKRNAIDKALFNSQNKSDNGINKNA